MSHPRSKPGQIVGSKHDRNLLFEYQSPVLFRDSRLDVGSDSTARGFGPTIRSIPIWNRSVNFRPTGDPLIVASGLMASIISAPLSNGCAGRLPFKAARASDLHAVCSARGALRCFVPACQPEMPSSSLHHALPRTAPRSLRNNQPQTSGGGPKPVALHDLQVVGTPGCSIGQWRVKSTGSHRCVNAQHARSAHGSLDLPESRRVLHPKPKAAPSSSGLPDPGYERDYPGIRRPLGRNCGSRG